MILSYGLLDLDEKENYPRIADVQTYLENSLPTVSEWQHSVWNTKEKPRQMIAPRKKAPKTIFSCNCISIDGLVRKYVATPINATQPKIEEDEKPLKLSSNQSKNDNALLNFRTRLKSSKLRWYGCLLVIWTDRIWLSTISFSVLILIARIPCQSWMMKSKTLLTLALSPANSNYTHLPSYYHSCRGQSEP